MSERQVIVFRSRLRAEHEAEFNRHAHQIYARALTMPGFLSTNDFAGEDGERLTIVEFDSPEAAQAMESMEGMAPEEGSGMTSEPAMGEGGSMGEKPGMR